MKYQVSSADYARCVDGGACKRADAGRVNGGHVPVTGVSFQDAQNYASWLSKESGQVWRLPSDEEWAYAAGSRFHDDALGIGQDGIDPSRRWLAEYRRNAERGGVSDPEPRPPGFYGENEHGISDLSGNVWEWTNSCYVRARVSDTGAIEKEKTANCGVRVVEGRHRAYMIFFVRDAKGGGCSVGAPPDNLGFRLVRDILTGSTLPR
jgi:formylglycine-generating enzyme required for sulfatase activity